jgi:hypothetical protein
MLKHLNELTRMDWFFTKPWILLGTGPSLDNFDYQKYKGTHNIAAVYDAAYACESVDIHFIADKQAFEWIKPKGKVATRIINTNRNNDNTYFWEYDCDFLITGQTESLFIGEPVYRCSNSSSFVVMWMGMLGIKNLLTCGIDGGMGFSKWVSKEYYDISIKDLIKLNMTFDDENQGVFGHAANFGIKLEKI